MFTSLLVCLREWEFNKWCRSPAGMIILRFVWTTPDVSCYSIVIDRISILRQVYNGKVAAEREWCIRHFDSGSCDVLQLDAFFGATHAAVTYRIESTFAPIQVNNSVTPYSESCLIPNDGALCNGCKDASRAIIAFLIIAIALSILGLYCHCRQVLTSVTRQSKIVLIISGTAMGICGITMLGSFHTNCFKRIPSDFNPRQGSCYVFCSFIFILG